MGSASKPLSPLPGSVGGRIARRLLLLAALTPGAAAALPEHFVAEFALETHGLTVGSTEVSLTPVGENGAVYQSVSAAAGLLSLFRDDRVLERSELRYGPEGRLQPVAYRYRREGHKDRLLTIDFDWKNGVAVNREGGKTWRFDIPEGTLDKLSYQLALMRDLARGKREVRYPIDARGKLKTYHLKVIGEERLATALGHLDTLKVRRIRDPENPQDTIIWCAPRLHYLPVKIMDQNADGSVLTVHIRSVRGFTPHPLEPVRTHSSRVAPR
jgi:hypothetical protein